MSSSAFSLYLQVFGPFLNLVFYRTCAPSELLLLECWYHTDSFNLLVNNGAAAGQVVFHVSMEK